MLITKAFDSFNERRYGRPWGAVVTFPDGKKPVYAFAGHWDGGYDGKAGSVVMDVDQGAVVAFGQKDHRGGNTSNTMYVVGVDGTLTETTEAQARERCRTPAVRSDLATERARLVERIAEIDAQLALG